MAAKTNGTGAPGATASIDERIAWVQAKASALDKTGKVKFGSTEYDVMQEHGVLAVLKPLLEQAKLSYSGGVAVDLAAVNNPTFEKEGDRAYILWHLEVRDFKGESRHGFYFAEGKDSADKAAPKAMTMANKYALQKFFQVPTEQVDDADSTSTAEHQAEDKKKEDAKPKPPTKRNLEVVIKTAKEAAEAGHIAQNRISANLQTTFGVSKIDQLDAKQLKAFAGWISDELKKSKASGDDGADTGGYG